MLLRFTGESGRRRLIQALSECQIFVGDFNAVEKVADAGKLFEFEKGQQIIVEGESDDDLFILLNGQFEIYVNKRLVAVRQAPQDVGEMSLVDPKALRSASVIARTPGVALKISEEAFSEIAEDHPKLWRNIASQLAERLRERGRLLKAPNELPRIFIGCSAESLEIAQQIQASLDHDPFEVVIWTDNVFLPSSFTLEDLMIQVDCSDFAIFLVMPDDLIKSREVESYGPRDNVLFEMGLFMGKLGIKRVFLVSKRGEKLKMPTDLLGIRVIDFNYSKTNLAASLGSVCTEIRRIVKQEGTF